MCGCVLLLIIGAVAVSGLIGYSIYDIYIKRPNNDYSSWTNDD